MERRSDQSETQRVPLRRNAESRRGNSKLSDGQANGCNWTRHYDEEWLRGMELRKKCAELMDTDAESMPRVWNLPRRSWQ